MYATDDEPIQRLHTDRSEGKVLRRRGNAADDTTPEDMWHALLEDEAHPPGGQVGAPAPGVGYAR